MFYPRVLAIRSACLFIASALTLAALSVGSAQDADDTENGPALNPSHPETYVVQKDDTLWDIAAMFLRDPWYWPEIWQINPQVENPHLIFPGDLLRLTYVDERPAIEVERGPAVSDAGVPPSRAAEIETGRGVVERLSPRIRYEPLEEAIPTIPVATLRAFLSEGTVLGRRQMRRLPYVIETPDAAMGSEGRDLYVRGTDAQVGAAFNLVQIGQALVDPDDNDVIGYEALFIGEGELRRDGDPATLSVTASRREILPGDFLMQAQEELPPHFIPHSPDGEIDGSIMSVVDGVSLIGQYQVVTINRGSRDGLEPGHVLTAIKEGRRILDRYHPRRRSQRVDLPDEPAGTIMVFRTYDRMSYALVMEADRPLAVLDAVRTPT